MTPSDRAAQAIAREHWHVSFPDDEWPGPRDSIVQADLKEARRDLEAAEPVIREEALREFKEKLLGEMALKHAGAAVFKDRHPDSPLPPPEAIDRIFCEGNAEAAIRAALATLDLPGEGKTR